MKGQASVNPNRQPSRGAEKLLASSAGVYVLGLLFISGAWKMTDMGDQQLGVIIFFILGILAGIMGGIFLGRGLYLRLRLKPGSLVPFVVLAILNLIVFALLGKPTPVADPGFGDLLVNAMWLVGAPVLLTANAYLLGFFFLPGRLRLSGTRRMILIPLLYGSLAAGILAGFSTSLWQRGSVPLEPLEDAQQLPRRFTLQEAIREFDKDFPPQIRLDQSKPTGVGLSVNPGVTFQSELNQVDLRPNRRVIEASGSVAMVDGRRVELRGRITFAGENIQIPDDPRDPFGRSRSGRSHGITYSSWQKEELVRLSGLPPSFASRYRWAYVCAFLVSGPEEFSMSGLGPPALRALGGGQMEKEEWTGGGGSWWTEHALRLPIGGPAELRLRIYDTKDRVEHTLPAREGETLSTETNRVLLAGMFPWKDSSVSPRSTEIRLGKPKSGDAGAGPSGEVVTTVVFYCFEPRVLSVGAVLRSGQTASGVRRVTSGRWLVCRVSAEMDEIDRLVLREEPEGVEVVFHIPKLQGLPPENNGVTDGLDIFLPRVSFAPDPWEEPDACLAFVLADRFRPERRSVERQVPGPYENVTIRELLDLCYPGRWWVKNGVVHTTNNRYGPILWRVKEALRELREG